MAAEEGYDGVIYVFDGLNHSLQYKTNRALNSSDVIVSIAAADLDRNGTNEIVALTYGGYILIINGQTGAETWRSTKLGGYGPGSNTYEYGYGITVDNVDGDAQPEILALIGSSIYQYDAVSKLQEWQTSRTIVAPFYYYLSPQAAITTFDIDGDGKNEILWSTYGGPIEIINAQTHAVIKSLKTTGVVHAIVGAVTGDGRRVVLATTDDTLWAFDTSTSGLWGRSNILGTRLGFGNHLAVTQTSKQNELLIRFGNSVAVSETKLRLLSGTDLSVNMSSPTAAGLVYPFPSWGPQPIEGDETEQTVAVTNLSPETANASALTIKFDSGIQVLSEKNGAACTIQQSSAQCTLGSVAPGAEINLTFKLRALAGGAFSGAASVTTSTSDRDQANNEFSVNYLIKSLPTAKDMTVTTDEDVPVRIHFGDALANGSFGVEIRANSGWSPLGTVQVESWTRDIVYSPHKNAAGTDVIEYSIYDYSINRESRKAKITITIRNVDDDPPVAMDDFLGTPEDTPLSLDSLTANDSDPDGSPIQLLGIGAPTHGNISRTANGGYLYTPDEDYFGSDFFTYTVSDGVNQTAGHVNLNVAPVNDLPVAAGADVVTAPGTAASIKLENDGDVEGPLLMVSYTQPKHGFAAYSGDGLFGYIPNAGYSGDDTFTYTVADRDGANAVGTIHIRIALGANNTPSANNDIVETPRGVVVTFTKLLDNDSDVDGDKLAIVAADPAQHGTTRIEGEGSITYTPDSDYTGQDQFRYQVSDKRGGTAWATVTVNVTAATVVNFSVSIPDDTKKAVGGTLDWGALSVIAGMLYWLRRRRVALASKPA